ncbi:MAG: CoA transferase [Chloroflexi bacterium]|nr:CoA transferase [Chloroflexota bacterium]
MTPLALEGVRVLDCTGILAGPFCTMLLADMGADVIKVERPGGGDDTRRMGPPFAGGDAVAFLMVNRNKRGIVLDLKSPDGIAVFKKLAVCSDIIVENLRPGAMKKLGLGYEDLSKDNPGLVYCSISGFGATGPYKDRTGFDLVAQGMSGMMSITGHPGAPPAKVGVPISDLNGGMYATYGILSAYINRLKTGKGQFVDTSLLEGSLAYTVWESATYFFTGQTPGPVGSAHRMTAPYQAFQTSDGYINVATANQKTWERLCNTIGREDLLGNPRFGSNADRVVNIKELATTLEDTFSKQPMSHWLPLLEKSGVPSGPINDMAAVYADPQVLARNMLATQQHPTAGDIKTIGIPVKLSDTPGQIRRPAPLLGQHTDEILREFDYSDEDIKRLRESGAIE